MGDQSAIEWCDATFNPWWGCVEVSPGCDHCYARTDARRYGHAIWGKDQPRRFFGDKHWDQPMRWDRRAREQDRRIRVFCASMADVLEERDDQVGRELASARLRLWELIAMTEATDWLLLTKRPQNYPRLVPREILQLPHVWSGTTVESADYLWRVGHLLDLNCAGPRWVSYEPALGPVDFDGDVYAGPGWLRGWHTEPEHWRGCDGSCSAGRCPEPVQTHNERLDWIVVAGESGPGARPFDLAWARQTIAQGRAAAVPVFVKQLGAQPFYRIPEGTAGLGLRNRKGSDPSEWPGDLRVREYPR